MARENQAEISKLEKAEAKRIKKLVNDAFKSDPRIELYYKKEAENKKLKKLKKLEKKREREKEEKRIEELQKEARKRDFDKKAKAKELEAIINNKILKLKSDFRKLTELHKINAKMANRIFTKTKSAELQKILDSNCGEYELYLVHSKLITKEIESMSTDWSDDEIVLLTKAFKRHPAGTIDRWGKISRHLEKSGVAKSESDIILKSAKLTGKDNLPRKLRSKSLSRYEEGPKWSSEQHFLLEKGIALTANVKCAKSRWTRIAAMIPRKSPKDCVDEFKRIRTSLLDKPR
ncbi:hypothetical protein MHBO_001426 [Bonamia ostreae]|uniref:Myb-like domain-containing protein n=1 Tax=Bonamia ostreae TaxID=126728 RepID=A0ABV2AJG0_9EUKA